MLQKSNSIAQLAQHEKSRNQAVAIEVYWRLGEVVGEALGQALVIVEGLTVIGGRIERSLLAT